jgi:glucokinase
VAGPLTEGKASITNLSLVATKSRILETFRFSSVHLLNNLESTPYSIPFLKPEEVHVLNEAVPTPEGTIAVIAPGTGLGEVLLVWDGIQHRACASEGGMQALLPQTSRT